MDCVKCSQPRIIEEFCGRCFSHLIEKRFKKEIDLEKNHTYKVDDIVRYFLSKTNKMPVKLVDSGDFPVISSFTSEFFIDKFLRKIFEGKIEVLEGIHPFRNITFKELEFYFKYNFPSIKPTEFNSDLLEMMHVFPDSIKHGLSGSIQSVSNIN